MYLNWIFLKMLSPTWRSLGFVATYKRLVTLQEFSIQHNLHRKCLFSVWKLRQQHIQDQVSKECRIFQCILCLLEVQVKSLLFGYFCAVHSVHFLSMKNWPIQFTQCPSSKNPFLAFFLVLPTSKVCIECLSFCNGNVLLC